MLLASALAAVSGCHKASVPANTTAQNNVKQYHLRGVVIATDTAKGVVTVNTEAIPGFMPPMIMPYKLENPGVASGLHPGDTITAELDISKNSDLLDQIVIVKQAKLNSLPKIQYQPLVPGESVPDFRFLNQNNKIIHIDQFHGKVLLVTFIYTRCPLSNYCPRMSRNFADINKTLAAEPKLYAKTHLLSVSFDPSYDTPSVLRSYGGAYTGKYTQATFKHWDFSAPPEKELSRVLKFFLIGITPEKNHVLAHSLSTVVITPQGKIYKWYPTNTWTPQQLLADINTLLKDQTHS
ncbi:MAG TPA: SCO family protein [Acidobacteriaceae bacterium]|nr:SCO family protein [Acidobacteriaceae bacterium]